MREYIWKKHRRFWFGRVYGRTLFIEFTGEVVGQVFKCPWGNYVAQLEPTFVDGDETDGLECGYVSLDAAMCSLVRWAEDRELKEQENNA